MEDPNVFFVFELSLALLIPLSYRQIFYVNDLFDGVPAPKTFVLPLSIFEMGGLCTNFGEFVALWGWELILRIIATRRNLFLGELRVWIITCVNLSRKCKLI